MFDTKVALVVRNDLATNESGQPPVAFARSSVRATAGVTLAKGFGPTFLDATGERVFPVEVYDLPVAAAAPTSRPYAPPWWTRRCRSPR